MPLRAAHQQFVSLTSANPTDLLRTFHLILQTKNKSNPVLCMQIFAWWIKTKGDYSTGAHTKSWEGLNHSSEGLPLNWILMLESQTIHFITETRRQQKAAAKNSSSQNAHAWHERPWDMLRFWVRFHGSWSESQPRCCDSVPAPPSPALSCASSKVHVVL